MNVGLAIEADRSVGHLMPAVRGINEALKSFFAEKQYGADLIYTAIGAILVDSSAVAQRLHSIRPFCYKRLDRVKHPGTGQIMEFHNSASWDVKPDFATFSGQSLQGARDYLCEALIASTNVLEEHRDQYPDFDVDRFRADFRACLRAHCGKPEGTETGVVGDTS
jgi:hypothetical protein